ncbi:hypothetical protein Msil_3167 [Methylocella silvestris BL2]|uniref:Uncharacterized protein n=1 Tax=Methylocella silvestris (strain DSM 15510 / CIP 108128 / LMG 27833 / NCIMB 13906 / BL2) TaxID=395965 RepID=B8EME7_METSB|nr:hypothetical protein Msil_3167 [Methylocella silvestris BL2]
MPAPGDVLPRRPVRATAGGDRRPAADLAFAQTPCVDLTLMAPDPLRGQTGASSATETRFSFCMPVG